jgi:hypothetical protein
VNGSKSGPEVTEGAPFVEDFIKLAINIIEDDSAAIVLVCQFACGDKRGDPRGRI